MAREASELAGRLAREAEAVCRHYLSNGRREGRYWLVGDVSNTAGRSLFVRLHASSRGAAGKWVDAATGEHGDLLDIIGTTCGLTSFREIAEEARRFLKLPRWQREPRVEIKAMRSRDMTKAARRLFAMAQPLPGTLGETYLANRSIDSPVSADTLRFHPRCFYRPDDTDTIETWPALIAAVTDLDGRITGVHRTWLDPGGFDARRLGKAPIDTPRRAMGDLLGHAVRFGSANDVLAAGEGIETLLSLRTVLPSLPVAAALSANHLATLLWPARLRRLYVALDADAAGINAAKALTTRALDAGIEAIALCPLLEDFNEDLRAYGKGPLREMLLSQLLPEDVVRLMGAGPA
ncbi:MULTISPECIES: toprim domain-containing protein [Bradyrhizobium]|uniref:DNA primase n=1 Tax=Bradyrhizobium aeschynomenes TaxID=2734909 RepID=A0ABX2CDU8_9BRAD|nr:MULTISPECIES: toprim domain-containing protein [Bradyrhizobium]NPU66391.1 DNA primase [Bradyrhizobium aeschynomenes]NPV20103.1 DNA primase [Bradyrhizobium aeschynomenes]